MPIALIGIDDTDNQTSPGTGKLARWLCAEIIGRGGKSLGITRHQLLLDERIPYTTHNSGACLAIDWPGELADLRFAMDRIKEWSAEGSDPGVCLAPMHAVPPDVIAFGQAAMRQVLTIPQALALAAQTHLELQPLGGTGQGVIGALASVGLRASGNDGRFLDMPGLRQLGEYVSRAKLAELGIKVDHRSPGESPIPPEAQAIYRTMDWVRPRLQNGHAVWPVEWNKEHHEWIPAERSRSRPFE